MTAVWLPVAIAAGAACIIGMMIYTRHPIRVLLRSSVTGLAALAAVNLTGMLTGVTLAISPAALGCSCLCGVPGVIGMLVMRLLAQ